MTWIILAISAHFVWAWVNIIDKYAVEHKVKNPYVYLSWLGLLSPLGLIVWPFIDLQVPGSGILGLIALAAALNLYGAFPYIKAAQREEISRINIWWQLIPVFGLIFGMIFMNQKLSGHEAMAFIILVLGGILASLHFVNKKVKFSKALGLMTISGVAFAIYALIFNYVTQYIDILSIIVWMSVFGFLVVWPVFLNKRFRKDFKKDSLELKNRKFLGLIILEVILDNGAGFLNIWALSFAPAALVFAFEGTQVLFVFLISLVFSVVAPKILKEKFEGWNFVVKFAALLIILFGVYLLHF